MKQTQKSISAASFIHDFVSAFPGDHSGDKRPRQTMGMLYSKVLPTPVPAPELVAWSAEMAAVLGLAAPSAAEDVAILAGNKITPTMSPYAACYAGHQFGNWAGQLGDGRAITLGELIGADNNVYELQLKGPGQTPYSRRADGRAVLRSSVREYLMSEAMYFLGVPTTRALSLVTTGEKILRDMFYDGHPAHEPGAIVLRVAPSFLRFGSFEMPAARGEVDNLRKLTDWTIARFYPHIKGDDKVLQWYTEVVDRTAFLMTEWLRVGFVHGVMNTDNMSILGLTIDYGPYSFVDDYDPMFTPNTTDLPGRRYAFGKQPSIAYWNLGCLANALVPLFEGTKELEAALGTYENVLLGHYYRMMGRKLGLQEVVETDHDLFASLEKILSAIQPDMTIFYQLLAGITATEMNEADTMEFFRGSFYKEPTPQDLSLLQQWMKRYAERLQQQPAGINNEIMRTANPRFVLRNYLLHQCIEGLENGDPALFRELEAAMKDPYDPAANKFFARRPDWASKKAGCSMLSCSS